MILEVAILNIVKGLSKEFETAFKKAEILISSSKGYISHELKTCIEEDNKYILLVKWETLKDHEIGFRQSKAYNKWKRLLHHFYHPFPKVEHYK